LVFCVAVCCWLVVLFLVRLACRLQAVCRGGVKLPFTPAMDVSAVAAAAA
jgi:hypothetical protein